MAGEEDTRGLILPWGGADVLKLRVVITGQRPGHAPVPPPPAPDDDAEVDWRPAEIARRFPDLAPEEEQKE
jgi:hypothetical protein